MKKFLIALFITLGVISTASAAILFFARAGSGIGGGGGGGAPISTGQPTVTGTPTMVQTNFASPSSWTGFTLALTDYGTWLNCSACTYTIQWYSFTGLQAGAIAQVPGDSFVEPDVPAATGGATINGPHYGDKMAVVVTATNSAGRATSQALNFTVDRQYLSITARATTAPVLSKCTDSTCATLLPAATSIAVGDYVQVSDGVWTGSPSIGAPTYVFVWTGPELLAAQSTIQSGASNIFQVPQFDLTARPIIGASIAGLVQHHTSLGTATSESNFLATIAPTGSTFGAPQPIVDGSNYPQIRLTYYPAGGGPLVGNIVQANAGLFDQPGFSPWPSVVTTQWYRCNSVCVKSVAGVALSGTPIPGETGRLYIMGTLDIGHQIFERQTATNMAGTTVQDSAPTLTAVAYPGFPAQGTVPDATGNILPSLTGYATYSTTGVGASPSGAMIVGNGGIWNNVAAYSYQYESCAPANPTCTTPAVGPVLVANNSLVKDFIRYTTDISDMGHILKLKVCGHNILTDLPGNPSSAAPCYESAPTRVVDEFVPTPPLAFAPARTFPAGQDVLQTDVCTAERTTDTGTVWYVGGAGADYPDAAHGGGAYNGGAAGTADGSSAHPFNNLEAVFKGSAATITGGQPGYYRPLVSTIGYNHGGGPVHSGVNGLGIDYDWNPASPDPTRINPGDTVVVRGTGILPMAATINPVAYGMPGPTAFGAGTGVNVDAAGHTAWIVIRAAAGANPQAPGLGLGGQGWQFKGITFRPVPGGSGSVVTISGVDNIVSDGTIGTYDSFSDAWADYNANCLAVGTTLCPNSTDLGVWVKTREKSGVTLNAPGHCIALDNNKIWFNTGVGIVTQANSDHDLTDVLVEQNDLGYSSDADDTDIESGTIVFHRNFDHDMMDVDAKPPHPDGYQTQPHSNFTEIGLWGLVMDSNITIVHYTTDMDVIADPHWCANNPPLASTCTHTVSHFSFSGMRGTAHFYTGTRVANHMYYGPDAFGIPDGTLATIVNSTFIGSGSTRDPSNQYSSSLALGYGSDGGGNYYANIIGDVVTCNDPLGVNVETNSLAIPTGTLKPSTAFGCSGGFTSTTDTGTLTNYAPTTDGLWNSGIDLHPTTGGVLYKAGVAGHGVPLTNILGVATTSPPTVGAY